MLQLPLLQNQGMNSIPWFKWSAFPGFQKFSFNHQPFPSLQVFEVCDHEHNVPEKTLIPLHLSSAAGFCTECHPTSISKRLEVPFRLLNCENLPTLKDHFLICGGHQTPQPALLYVHEKKSQRKAGKGSIPTKSHYCCAVPGPCSQRPHQSQGWHESWPCKDIEYKKHKKLK